MNSAPIIYLELSDAGVGAHKFYAVTRDGPQVTIRFGRIGAAGRTETHAFATEAEARAFAEGKVREKTAKGYAPATPGERAPLLPPTPPAPGTEAWFWRLVESAKRGTDGDCEAQCAALQEKLALLPIPDILAFQRVMDDVQRDSYRADLWGAAFLINGGSDDGFEYFRGWLIMQGEGVYRAALQDPDSLTRIVPDTHDVECEDALYTASYAYEAKTGRDDFHDLLPSRSPNQLIGDFADWDDGNGDMDAQKAQALYPRLWQKFGW